MPNRYTRIGKLTPCKNCGVPVYIEPNQEGRKKFCTKKCFYEGRELKQLFKKGHSDLVPASKRGHTEETKRKISLSQKGKKKKALNEYKRSFDYNERRRFYHSVKKQVLQRDNYTCQICNKKGGNLHVDHIQSWKEYIELRFNIDNCRTLCMDCHYQITFGKPMPPTVRAWGNNFLKGGDIL